MKTLASTLIITAALAAASPAEAHDRGRDRAHNHFNEHFNERYDDQRYRDKRHNRKHYRKIRLDVPVNWRGDGRLKLKRLAQRYHGIDLDQYRLVRVVLDSHGRRHGVARLRVGQYQSDLVYLNRGRSVIHAPQTRGSARWVLKLDNAKISNVRLVLEPRKRRHFVHNHHHVKPAWSGRQHDKRHYNKRYNKHYDKHDKRYNKNRNKRLDNRALSLRAMKG